MTTSNTQKTALLGMPFGTASTRLRKRILYWLLVRHAENVCYQCDQSIDHIDDLSIEHKIPWQSNVELFWDLDNIAFSHLHCNVGARKMGEEGLQRIREANYRTRKVGPEGTAWCCRGQHFEQVDRFFEDRGRWNGLSNECRACRNERRTP